jgi:hypothetical protein
MFRQGFSCPALLKSSVDQHVYGAITHFGRLFQTAQLRQTEALACSAFARHY